MHNFNLLKYPNLAGQQKRFFQAWTGFAGLVLGGLLAMGVRHGQETQTALWQQERARLQAALDQQAQRAQQATRQQAQWRVQAVQVGQLQQIAERQQVWQVLHQALQNEAERSGLRLTRLQAEGEKIELHGSVPQFEALASAQRHLSERLQQSFELTSLNVGPGEEISLVWQSAWPVVPAALAGKPPAAANPSPTPAANPPLWPKAKP